ncbi:hypothetical protein BD414DRAFT_204184 [Trametes punicea]|nr:hypothetical protein BD414DRAFT_204184 [Trametes punicea]
MPQVPPTGLPCKPKTPEPYATRPNIQPRPAGPRQPRTQSDLNDIRLRRVSTAVARAPSKHSQQTPDVLPKPCRSATGQATSAPSLTSVSSAPVSPPSLVPTDAPSLIMTTTMTVSSPAQLRVSDSTPTFLLQKTHGPPPYFLHRIPTSPALRSSPSAPQLKHKRSFKVATHTSPPSSVVDAPAVPHSTQLSPGDENKIIKAGTPDATGAPVQQKPLPVRRTTLPPLRTFPMPSPPPEKALPPIPFPSSPPSPTAGRSESSPRLLAPPTPDSSGRRPVSQDAEETLRQLEQLAAELKEMGPGVLAAAKQRRSRVPTQRRRRDVLGKSASAGLGAGSAGKGSLPKRNLSVPRIVVTNPSSEDLVAEPECDSARSDGGSGDVSEEELWVDGYGAWGASEKGKWKASASDDEDEGEEGGFHESAPCTHNSRLAASAMAAESDGERFYIYEPIGAPEFLAGSSTSPIARAVAGFHSGSLAPTTVSKQHSPPVRRRRRRPAALVLATPEQAEWFADIVMGSAPPTGSRLTYTAMSTGLDRTSTAPGGDAVALGLPAPPSPRLPPRRAMSSDAPERSHMPAPLASISNTVPDRRSEPLGAAAVPRVSSAAFDASPQSGHVSSWVSAARNDKAGTSSEPNSPRLGVRPRLKSIKGLFKHFSK